MMDSLDADEFTAVRFLVPDDALCVLSSVVIVRYADEKGEEQIRFKHTGEAALSTTIGMLEFVKYGYMQDAEPMGDVD